MSPPFDTEREANEDLRNEDLGVVQLPEQDQDFPAQIEASEETANEEEAEPDKADTSVSSVQQYLQDIGSVRLLSREREIELAKEVESATQQIFEALFSTPFALRRIEALGAALSAGELELREVIAKSDDEDEERETNVDLKPLLKQVGKLARLLRQWDRIRADLRRARLSEQTRNRLLRNEHAQLVKVFGVIKALRLSSEQIERMIGQLTGLTERMIGLEAQARGHSRAKKKPRYPRSGGSNKPQDSRPIN